MLHRDSHSRFAIGQQAAAGSVPAIVDHREAVNQTSARGLAQRAKPQLLEIAHTARMKQLPRKLLLAVPPRVDEQNPPTKLRERRRGRAAGWPTSCDQH